MYKGEHVDPVSGERKFVALKKLNMINEKDGVRRSPHVVESESIVSNNSYERDKVFEAAGT